MNANNQVHKKRGNLETIEHKSQQVCPLLLSVNFEWRRGKRKVVPNSFFVHFQASTDGNLETGDWLIANRSDCSRSSFASLSNNLLRLENPRGKSWFQTCICWGSSGIFMYPCYYYLCTLYKRIKWAWNFQNVFWQSAF